MTDRYRDVPYHSAAHAACVTHSLHQLVTQQAGLAELFRSPLAIFTAIFSAMIHDLGHTGHNNAFHVATSSELAV